MINCGRIFNKILHLLRQNTGDVKCRGGTEGARGHNVPGTESLAGREDSQQCLKYFL